MFIISSSRKPPCSAGTESGGSRRSQRPPKSRRTGCRRYVRRCLRSGSDCRLRKRLGLVHFGWHSTDSSRQTALIQTKNKKPRSNAIVIRFNIRSVHLDIVDKRPKGQLRGRTKNKRNHQRENGKAVQSPTLVRTFRDSAWANTTSKPGRAKTEPRQTLLEIVSQK